jgi:hypothetical protein
MLTTMATALLNAIPGESPETRLATFAERLGAVYEGSCWRMSPAVRETLRDAAVALALEPPEPVDDATDPGWEAVVLAADLPVTPETLAWAASLEDSSVLPVEAPWTRWSSRGPGRGPPTWSRRGFGTVVGDLSDVLG